MVASGETAVLGAYRYSVWRVTYIVTAFALRPPSFISPYTSYALCSYFDCPYASWSPRMVLLGHHG